MTDSPVSPIGPENDTQKERPCTGIGGRLRSIRGKISREKFSKIMEVGKNSLVRYENEERNPDADFLASICEKFQISPQWLLFGKGQKTWVENPNAEHALNSIRTSVSKEPMYSQSNGSYEAVIILLKQEVEDILSASDELYQSVTEGCISDETRTGGVNIDLLKQAIEIVTRIAELKRKKLDPEKLAMAIGLLYQLSQVNGEVDEAAAEHLLKLSA